VQLGTSLHRSSLYALQCCLARLRGPLRRASENSVSDLEEKREALAAEIEERTKSTAQSVAADARLQVGNGASSRSLTRLARDCPRV